MSAATPWTAPSEDVYVHPSSCVDEGCVVGRGTRIWHFCHVMPGARLGRGCSLGQNVMVGPGVVLGDGVRVQNNVSLYEGVELGDFVFCGPSVVFTNVRFPRAEFPRRDAFLPTRVRRGATLGANATVVCGVEIGAYALVGAGAVVTRDVPAHALVLGAPARRVGWVCRCGERLPGASGCAETVCAACGRRYAGRAGALVPLDPEEAP